MESEQFEDDDSANAEICKQNLIKRWNTRTEPEARALTMEELRQMDGKPVYIVEWPKWGHWELSEDADGYFDDRDTDFYNFQYDDPAGRYGLHISGWLAFDCQPKEE